MQDVWSNGRYKMEGLLRAGVNKREFVGVEELAMDAIFFVGGDGAIDGIS